MISGPSRSRADIPDRTDYPFTIPHRHAVLGAGLRGPWGDGVEVMYVAMGCFWGAEEYYWRLPGVVSTAAGYMGGTTAYPTYEEVCTGRTGHAETVLVAYDPATCSTLEILRLFWEHHDPTQGDRQGNDIGTQYRSAIFWTTEQQHSLAEQTRDAYQDVLTANHLGRITTHIEPASGHPFYYAEEYHQQYLHKVEHGYQRGSLYRCHSATGIRLPM